MGWPNSPLRDVFFQLHDFLHRGEQPPSRLHRHRMARRGATLLRVRDRLLVHHGRDHRRVYYVSLTHSTLLQISRDRQPVAALHWGIGPGLGQANISGMEVSIDDLIRPGSTAK